MIHEDIRLTAGSVALLDLAADRTGLIEETLQIQLRSQDFVTMSVKDPRTGQEQVTGAHALLAFTATAFKRCFLPKAHVPPEDTWMFRVPTGNGAASYLYVSGKDILTVKVASKVI